MTDAMVRIAVETARLLTAAAIAGCTPESAPAPPRACLVAAIEQALDLLRGAALSPKA